MKIKIMKNLYQFLSTIPVVVIIDVCLLSCYFVNLSNLPNYGWIFLLTSLLIIFLYFIIGGYWIFQVVVIDKDGIRILIFNKTIKNVTFDKVEKCKYTNVARNPSITIYIENQRHINVDKRKKLINCLKYYGIDIEN